MWPSTFVTVNACVCSPASCPSHSLKKCRGNTRDSQRHAWTQSICGRSANSGPKTQKWGRHNLQETREGRREEFKLVVGSERSVQLVSGTVLRATLQFSIHVRFILLGRWQKPYARPWGCNPACPECNSKTLWSELLCNYLWKCKASLFSPLQPHYGELIDSPRYGAASAKSDMDLMIFVNFPWLLLQKNQSWFLSMQDPKRIGGFAPSKKRLPSMSARCIFVGLFTNDSV